MRIFIQLIHEGWWFCFLSGAATLACLACWCGLGAVMSVARGLGAMTVCAWRLAWQLTTTPCLHQDRRRLQLSLFSHSHEALTRLVSR